MTALFAFLHHLAAFTLFGFLTVEFILLKGELTVARARQIVVADGIYGASALVVLVVGLLRVYFFEKGSDYYFHSIPFIIKLTIFIVIGLISIYPTLEILSWHSSLKQNKVPAIAAAKLKTIRTLLHLELAGFTVILICAALMAKGVGNFG
jgi:putative membrane protein